MRSVLIAIFICGSLADTNVCSDPNSHFDPCGDANPITCANKDKLRITAKECLAEGGCVCNEGFVRDYKGRCIPPNECPVCGADEEFNCGPVDDRTCDNLGQPRPIVGECTERCYCIIGYARDSQNVCIPIRQCPAKPCGKNERYNPFPLPYPQLTCKDLKEGIKYDPFLERMVDPVPRCECNDGYIRKVENGECIAISDCLQLPPIPE